MSLDADGSQHPLQICLAPGRRAAAAAVLIFLAASPAVAGEAADVVFAPHRAIYDLSLDKATPGSGVSQVSGRVAYELTGSPCEGYAQRMRLVTVTTNQEGKSQTSDLRTSSWEEVPSRRLRFTSSSVQNERTSEQTQGSAERSPAAGPVQVQLSRPAKRNVEIPENVYFPIQHSMAIIRLARQGGHILSANLFDGSETGDKVYATSTSVGDASRPGTLGLSPRLKEAKRLEAVRSWPISIGYYPADTNRADAVPIYEMSYRFHENGVTSSLRIDHGDYAMAGELIELTYLPAGKCPGPPRPQ